MMLMQATPGMAPDDFAAHRRLVGKQPSVLGEVLAGMDEDRRLLLIDTALDSRDKQIIALGFQLNDIRVMLKDGARPEDIFFDPLRGGLIDLARERPWPPLPTPPEGEDWKAKTEAEFWQDEYFRAEQSATPDLRYPVLMPDDILAWPPIGWRVRHVLPAAGLAAIYGMPKTAKSFLLLHLAVAITGARSWFGYRTTPCHVLYVCLEGEAGIPSRLRALQARRGALPRNLAMIMQPFDIRSRKDRDDLVLAAKAAGYKSGILVIDTLNRAAPGMDENDSASMGAVIAGAKALQEALGGLVLLVHHSGKDASKGPRGHSSLSAAVDVAIEVCRDGDRREWKIALAKDGPDAAGHGFRLEVVEIGTDPEDGEPITSCVVVPDESSDAGNGKPTPPKGGNQRIVLMDALHDNSNESRLRAVFSSPPMPPAGP